MKSFFLTLIVLMFGGCAIVGSDYDTPTYAVISAEDRFEVRDYAPYLAAEVTVPGAQRDALNDGFRILADYIFGNNVAMTAPVTSKPAPQKVSMTVPVMQSPSENAWVVRFMMPHTYTEQTLPKPNNPNIRIVTVPGARKAVIRFSGFASESNFKTRTRDLDAYLAQKGLEATGPAERAYYNPPWTPPFLKRNEVLVPLKAP